MSPVMLYWICVAAVFGIVAFVEYRNRGQETEYLDYADEYEGYEDEVA